MFSRSSCSTKPPIRRGFFISRTKGCAPTCANEWKPGVCEKPKVKCGECPHQAFIPVDDQVVLDHLRGRHVIGAYPMLEDDTCWFLAADFDESLM